MSASEQEPSITVAPILSARSASSVHSRLLPMPASPVSTTTDPSPRQAASRASSSVDSSSSRPTRMRHTARVIMSLQGSAVGATWLPDPGRPGVGTLIEHGHQNSCDAALRTVLRPSPYLLLEQPRLL